MNKTEVVLEIVKNVEFVQRHCHICPPLEMPVMVAATVEIDKNASTLSGIPHVAAPSGEDGSPAARFHLISIKEKIQKLPTTEDDNESRFALEQVLFSMVELRRGLEDVIAARL